MENNNISNSQGHQFYKMSDNNTCHNSKSDIIRNLEDGNFIPFENIDPYTFINVLEDDVVYRVIDDHDSQ